MVGKVAIIARQIKENIVSTYLVTSDRIVGHEETLATDHQGLWDSGDSKFESGSSSSLEDSGCLLYTSPSPRDLSTSRMPSSA